VKEEARISMANKANRYVVDRYDDFASEIKSVIDQSTEPKQKEVSEEINIFEDSTYTIQFRDNETSRGTSDFKFKGRELLKLMLPISVVTEKEYIPSDAFADELSVWREKDYALQTSSMKEREPVEFAEWCVVNANPNFPNKGQWYYKSELYNTEQLYQLFTK
jgi:hypothetical protein